MHKEFRQCYLTQKNEVEWLVWIGCPILYDGGLRVNRTTEEVAYTNNYKFTSHLCV